MPHVISINTCTHSHTERERQKGEKLWDLLFFNAIKLILVKEKVYDLLSKEFTCKGLVTGSILGESNG